MKKAIIDLGTNTFNLLIGEIQNGHLTIKRTEKEAVLLGMNGINHGRIADEAWLRGIQALIKFKKYCKEEEVTDIIGIGTSALRGASNGEIFIREVKEQTGIEIRIISGKKECQLIYNGVKQLYNFDSSGVIMDIGGGSTEFIVADVNGILNTGSFDIGVSRLYQELNKKHNLKKRDYEFIESYLEHRVGPFFKDNNSNLLIGASGSFETFYEMIFQKRYSNANKLEVLPLLPLLEQIDWVLDSRFEDRMNNEWIIPMRKKMLPIAAFKIKWIIEKLKIENVMLCPYSLKEGAFLD